MTRGIIHNIADREVLNDERHHDQINIDALLKLLYTLEMSLVTEGDEVEDRYRYIPFSHLTFLKTLRQEAKDKDINYLEVGCGIGTKLYLAKRLVGLKRVTGLDINPHYLDVASNLINFDEGTTLIQVDALKFKRYDEFDLLYMYAPLKIGQHKLNKKIRKRMKVGAKLLTPHWNTKEIEVWTKTDLVSDCEV